MRDRPPADELLPDMLERPPQPGPNARPKLTQRAHRNGAEVRCRRRHLLAAAVRTPDGVWLVWHGNVFGHGWRSDWLDEIPDPAELLVWCAPCNMNHTVDVSAHARPRLLR